MRNKCNDRCYECGHLLGSETTVEDGQLFHTNICLRNYHKRKDMQERQDAENQCDDPYTNMLFMEDELRTEREKMDINYLPLENETFIKGED